MRTIHVLGCGPSIKSYKKTDDFTIGVNDIYKYVETDALVLLDKPRRFTQDRLNVIRNSTPFITYSSLRQWDSLPNFQLIELDEKGGSLEHLDNPKIFQQHVDSTFAACCIAYKHLLPPGPKQIILYGADFYKHPELEIYIPAIQQVYRNLYLLLKTRDCKLFIGNQTSALSNILPFYKI